jgi:hypothetical protein
MIGYGGDRTRRDLAGSACSRLYAKAQGVPPNESNELNDQVVRGGGSALCRKRKQAASL